MTPSAEKICTFDILNFEKLGFVPLLPPRRSCPPQQISRYAYAFIEYIFHRDSLHSARMQGEMIRQLRVIRVNCKWTLLHFD